MPAAPFARSRRGPEDPEAQGRNVSKRITRIGGQHPVSLPEPRTSPHPAPQGTIPFGSRRQYRRDIPRTGPWQRPEDVKATENRISTWATFINYDTDI